MPTKIVMPKLSLTMKEGMIGKWYKKEGDTVEKDEPIVEIVSEKATYDLEAPTSGVLRKILVEQGSNALVNQMLAVIASPDETLTELDLKTEVSQAASETEKTLASPAAKRLARERGIDLAFVKGTGTENRISEKDVEDFINQNLGMALKIRETVQLTGLRKTSAERVSTSFKTAPHSTIVMEVGVSRALALHSKLQVSYTAMLVRVAALALEERRVVNSSLEGDTLRIFEAVNVGVAVATENGLIVPVVKDADKKSIKEIDAILRELTVKAKDGKLSKEEISGGTFTITNLGMYGVDFFTPIINPPEAAILGVGTVKERAVVVNGKVESKPTMMLSLSYDHRIVDGAPAAEFLHTIKEKFEKIDAE